MTTFDETTPERVPYVFQVGPMVAALTTLAPPLTAEEISAACGRVGRNWAPDLLDHLFDSACLTTAAAATAVAEAWSDAEFPEHILGRNRWRKLFKFAGYNVDGRPAPRPADPVKVYRGADVAHRRGWSWTTNLEMSEWFARRWDLTRPGTGQVWTMLAPPERLLAYIDGPDSRSESEYVVDTRGLTVDRLEVIR